MAPLVFVPAEGGAAAQIDRPETPPGIHAQPAADQAASEEGEEDTDMASTAERVQEVALAQVELRGQQAVLATRLDHVAEKVEGIDARGERLEARCQQLEEGQRKHGEQLAGVVEVTGRIPALEAGQIAQTQKMDRVLVLLEGGSGVVGTGDLARATGGAAGGPLGAALGVALKALGPTGTLVLIVYLLWSGKISL